jgi:hypothetical protein
MLAETDKPLEDGSWLLRGCNLGNMPLNDQKGQSLAIFFERCTPFLGTGLIGTGGFCSGLLVALAEYLFQKNKDPLSRAGQLGKGRDPTLGKSVKVRLAQPCNSSNPVSSAELSENISSPPALVLNSQHPR